MLQIELGLNLVKPMDQMRAEFIFILIIKFLGCDSEIKEGKFVVSHRMQFNT
jgi:hypothetical protein